MRLIMPVLRLLEAFVSPAQDPETFAYREHVRFALPESLVFMAVSPGYEVLTENSRRVLPDSIPLMMSFVVQIVWHLS